MKSIGKLLVISLSQAAKILAGLFLVKAIALYHGPKGMGLLGNFISFVSILILLAGGGITNGVIKYASDYSSDRQKLLLFRNRSLSYSLVSSLFVTVIVILSSPLWFEQILKNSAGPNILIPLLLTSCLVGVSNVVTGFLTAAGDIYKLSILSAIGYILSLPAIVFFARRESMLGVSVAIFISSIFVSAVQLWQACRDSFFKGFKFDIEMSTMRSLFGFSTMLLVSASLVPVGEIFIRGSIIKLSGVESAGIWQGVYRMGMVILSFGSLFLSYHYLPKVAQAKSWEELRKLVKEHLRIVFGIMIVAVSVGFFFRREVVALALSSDFFEASDFIVYQLIGDLFRLASYVFGFIIVARAHTKLYVLAEVVQVSIWVILTLVSLNMGFGLKGVFVAYASTYLLYLIIVTAAYRFVEKKRLLLCE